MRLLLFAGLLQIFCVSTVLSSSNFKAGKLWNREIPYEFSMIFKSTGSKDIPTVLKALEEFHKTCIKFVPRTNQTDYIIIDNKFHGCNSDVGRVGGGQVVNLGSGCVDYNVIVHEMMHAVGFYHEHQRPDRNEYVKINMENAIPHRHYAFHRLTETEVIDLGVTYDYESRMHYLGYAFTKNGKPTIEAINNVKKPFLNNGSFNPDYKFIDPAKHGLSKLDVLKLSKMCELPTDGSDPCFDKSPEYCTVHDAKDMKSLCEKKDVDIITGCRKTCGLCTTAHEDVKDKLKNCARKLTVSGACALTKYKFPSNLKYFKEGCQFSCYCKKRAMEGHCRIAVHEMYMKKNCGEVCKLHDRYQKHCKRWAENGACENKSIHFQNTCGEFICVGMSLDKLIKLLDLKKKN